MLVQANHQKQKPHKSHDHMEQGKRRRSNSSSNSSHKSSSRSQLHLAQHKKLLPMGLGSIRKSRMFGSTSERLRIKAEART